VLSTYNSIVFMVRNFLKNFFVILLIASPILIPVNVQAGTILDGAKRDFAGVGTVFYQIFDRVSDFFVPLFYTSVAVPETRASLPRPSAAHVRRTYTPPANEVAQNLLVGSTDNASGGVAATGASDRSSQAVQTIIQKIYIPGLTKEEMLSNLNDLRAELLVLNASARSFAGEAAAHASGNSSYSVYQSLSGSTGGTSDAGLLTGLLGIAHGGTGTTTAPTYGKVLLGNSSGGYDLVATSSLGISGGGGSGPYTLTGTNIYSSDARVPGDGDYNYFSGFEAGNTGNTGDYNIFHGYQAGASNATGYGNNFIGHNTGASNATGYYNNFFGGGAGASNNDGYSNNFFGEQAGYYNTSGYENNFFGYNAGVNNTAGYNNTFLGHNSGFYNSSGYGNIAIGYQAGYTLSTGNNNILIGSQIYPQVGTSNNQLSIGNLIFGTDVDGSGTTAATGKIGIGVAAPGYKLDVGGDIHSSSSFYLGGSVYDDNELESVNPTGRTLFDSSGNTNVDWQNTQLKSGGTLGLHWGNRKLVSDDGSTSMLDWSNTGTAGNYYFASGKLIGDGSGLTSIPNTSPFLTIGTGNIYSSNSTAPAGGSYNFFAGEGAGGGASNAGNSNVAIGPSAGYQLTSGESNVFIGNSTGAANDTGVRNTFLGVAAGAGNTTGSYNIAIGQNAGDIITTGSHNIVIGDSVDVPSATDDYQLSIGNLIYGTDVDGTGATPSTGNIGIGVAAPVHKLDVDGDIYTTGDVCGGSQCLNTLSDRRLKENITSLATSTLEKILTLNPVTFKWNDIYLNSHKGLLDATSTKLGFIAQDMEMVFPEVVTRNNDGYIGIDYGKLTAVLTAGFQEIYKMVKDIKSEVAAQGRVVSKWFINENTLKVPTEGTLQIDGQICVDEVCMNKNAFKQMMLNAGASVGSIAPSTPPPNGGNTGSTTPEVTGVEGVTPPVDEGEETPPEAEEPVAPDPVPAEAPSGEGVAE